MVGGNATKTLRSKKLSVVRVSVAPTPCAPWLTDRKDLLEIVGRPRDDVHANQLADAAGGGGARVGGCLHRPDVPANNRGHETGVDLLPAHEDDIRRLEHRVSGFDHPHESAGFDH